METSGSIKISKVHTTFFICRLLAGLWAMGGEGW